MEELWCRIFKGDSHKGMQAVDPGIMLPGTKCTKPKRPKNSEWFKEKMLVAQTLESGAVLDEEHMAFLADNEDAVTKGQGS
ncbi:hypothetical protein Tco_1466419 [Tanacetum coccineum]